MSVESKSVTTENYLLTLASRLSNVKAVVVLVAEADGRFTNHQANLGDVPWANIAGNLAAIEHDILNNKLRWEPVQVDGSEIPEE
jgi:hypothetical protein